jgi:hypothetical protein
VLIDEPGGTYWSRWLRFLREELLSEGYISEGDFRLFERVDSIDAAIERISHFYSRYHSMRYVDKKLVIRLLSALNDSSVKNLNKQFSDILDPGGSIYLSEPLSEEVDEPEIAHMPRLIIDFNLQDFGKLRTLIDAINSC